MRDLKLLGTRFRIGAGSLASLPAEMPCCGAVTVITDSNVAKHHLETLVRRMPKGLIVRAFIVEAGEDSKSLDTAADLLSAMASSDPMHRRDELVIALGGGMVCDLAGFVSSVYMRGTPHILIPTSLLAQIDASAGSKTGVNLGQGKNLVGTFHRPRAVLIDPALLATLPEREYRSAFAEAIKCAMIASPSLFSFLKKNRHGLRDRKPLLVSKLIEQCLKIKFAFVAPDEHETKGRRAFLNFGHTVGHALESGSNFKLLHGEAVSLGMLAETSIAVEKGVCHRDCLDALHELISDYGLEFPMPPVPAKKLAKFFDADKKHSSGKRRMVLPTAIGKAKLAVI